MKEISDSWALDSDRLRGFWDSGDWIVQWSSMAVGYRRRIALIWILYSGYWIPEFRTWFANKALDSEYSGQTGFRMSDYPRLTWA